MAKGKDICEATKSGLIAALKNDFKDVDSSYITVIKNYTCSTKGKRSPSNYNIFIGECMKEGKSMSDCAGEYRAQKGNANKNE